MAVNNPDGGSVTVNQPPDPSGPTPPSGLSWSVVHEVDFTACGGAKDTVWTSAPDGTTVSIGTPAVDWGAAADGVTTAAAITGRCNPATQGSGGGPFGALRLDDGVGLTVTPSVWTQEWHDATYAPRAYAMVSDLVPGVTDSDTVAFQLYANATQDPMVPADNYGGIGGKYYGLSLGKISFYAPSSGGQFCFASAQAISEGGPSGGYGPTGVAGRLARGQDQKSYFPKTNNQNLFEIVARGPLGSVEIVTGEWSGSWPDVGALPDRASAQINSPYLVGGVGAAAQVPLSTAAVSFFAAWNGQSWPYLQTVFPAAVAFKFRALKLS